MKLVDLVNYFRNGGSFEQFCQSQSLDLDSEVVEVYMTKPFELNKDLSFFEIEKTEGDIEYIFNGISFFNLFDFYYFLDVVEESKNSVNVSLTDTEIAEKLFAYAIDDA